MITAQTLTDDLRAIRSRSPLVHNITNYVVMNNTANALLAAGASPVMAHAVDEAEDMVKLASALVINIGTLSQTWIDGMLKAGKAANKKGIPVVLDPVGAGATPYRTRTARQIMKECLLSVIRGNASEIMAVAGIKSTTRGVDSLDESHAAIDAARMLTENTGAVIVVSGIVDMVICKNAIIRVNNGSPLMAKVTGMGCTATALIGAFVAVNSNHFHASAHAMALMGIAGEMAADKAAGPGSMQMHFTDALYTINHEDIVRHFNVES